MAKSFFKILTCLEEEIVLKEGSAYSEETKEIVKEIISFVENGSITDANIPKFVCKNFRLDNQALLRAYNLSVPYDKMISTSTLRSYVSRLSNELYDIFGYDFDEVFINNDYEKQRKLRSLANISNMENLSFQDLFIDVVDEKASTGLVKDNITLADCEDELKALKKLTRAYAKSIVEGLDASKLAYIKRVLNKPIINSKNLNYDKIDILRYFDDSDDT